MNCRRCGLPGVRIGTRLTPRGRRLAVMRCVRPSCRFEFESWWEKKKETGRPTWMVPEREVR